MFAAVVCDRFGWTFQEYQSQPWPFLRTISAMLEAEAEEAERARRKS